MRHAPAFATRLEFGWRLFETNISVAALSSAQILPLSENTDGSSVKELRSNCFSTNVGSASALSHRGFILVVHFATSYLINLDYLNP